MLGFGEEELTIESNAIPCLIFTQLIVLLLLFALLFFFVVSPLDPHDNLVTADTPPPSTSSNVFLFDAIQQVQLPLPIHDSSPSHSTTTRQHRILQVGDVVSASENGCGHNVQGVLHLIFAYLGMRCLVFGVYLL
uniref:Uncharacterized protein n=1 Tax=Phaseolus vulgaris TaxID=3885 RepID=V7AY99_PHAVU|nr:hypothetical protein PHAVU_009G139900g [Phaseolus vulgaris]ESW09593.1 hypothetical protein PHAVU_009G139900g [Phaseolus vulgaris]